MDSGVHVESETICLRPGLSATSFAGEQTRFCAAGVNLYSGIGGCLPGAT